MERNSWKPRYGLPPWLQTEAFACHKKEDEVTYIEPAPSPEENELLNFLMEDLRTRQEQSAKYAAEYDKLFAQDATTGDLTPEEKQRLESITNTYINSRTTRLDEEGEQARLRVAERQARTGMADSSIAENAYGALDKNLGLGKDQITREGELFRYGTEQDLRKNMLAERLNKIGVLNSLRDPSQANALFGNLANQRSAEANRLLQVALGTAQNSGGIPWSTVGTVAGMGAGALLAIPTGGMSVLGGAALGGALGGGAGLAAGGR